MIPQSQVTGSKGVSISSSPNYEQPGAKVVVLTNRPRSITTTKNTTKRILGPSRPSTSLGLTPTTGRHHSGSAPIAVRNSKIVHSTTSITSESKQSSYADKKHPNASSSQNNYFGRSHSAKTSILSIPIESNSNNSHRPCINTVSVPKTATHRQENNPSKNVSPPYASEGCDLCLTTPEKSLYDGHSNSSVSFMTRKLEEKYKSELASNSLVENEEYRNALSELRLLQLPTDSPFDYSGCRDRNIQAWNAERITTWQFEHLSLSDDISEREYQNLRTMSVSPRSNGSDQFRTSPLEDIPKPTCIRQTKIISVPSTPISSRSANSSDDGWGGSSWSFSTLPSALSSPDSSKVANIIANDTKSAFYATGYLCAGQSEENNSEFFHLESTMTKPQPWRRGIIPAA